MGRLFREFAMTLSVAIILSLLVSLTMTPMMCARLSGPRRDEEQHNIFYRLSGVDRRHHAARAIEKSLGWVLRHQPLILGGDAGDHRVEVYLYIIVPKGFFPQQDSGRMGGTILADQATSFQAMRERVLQLVKIVMEDPAVESLNAYVGGSGGGGAALNSGQHERHAQAAGGAQDQLRRSDRAPAAQDSAAFRARACICRPSRICASAAQSAARNTNTRCKATA